MGTQLTGRRLSNAGYGSLYGSWMTPSGVSDAGLRIAGFVLRGFFTYAVSLMLQSKALFEGGGRWGIEGQTDVNDERGCRATRDPRNM